jgi:hypothetical protein
LQNGAGELNFLGNGRVFGPFNAAAAAGGANSMVAYTTNPGDRRTFLAVGRIVDGTSNTIAFTTGYARLNGNNARFWAVGGVAPTPPSTTQPPSTTHLFATNATMPSLPTTSGTLPAFCTTTSQNDGYWQLGVRQTTARLIMPQSFGSGGLSVALLDGSVRMINPSMSRDTWVAATLPNDNVSLGADWNQ